MGGRSDYDMLLSMMKTSRTSVLKASQRAETIRMATVQAATNYPEKIPPELLDSLLYLP
ncbi:MAG: hypothetical protein QXV97_05960 [Candidatus Caldarchaeum sp.]